MNYIERAIALAELNNWTINENIVRALAILIQRQEEQAQQMIKEIVENSK